MSNRLLDYKNRVCSGCSSQTITTTVTMINNGRSTTRRWSRASHVYSPALAYGSNIRNNHFRLTKQIKLQELLLGNQTFRKTMVAGTFGIGSNIRHTSGVRLCVCVLCAIVYVYVCVCVCVSEDECVRDQLGRCAGWPIV